MKRITLSTILLLAMTFSMARAADDCAPLLCDQPVPAPAAAACPPAPPACTPPPPPACTPPPPVCEAPPAPVCAPPPRAQKPVVNSYKAITVKRTVYEDETYTTMEKRTRVDKVQATKDIKPKAPRLVRGGPNRDKPIDVARDTCTQTTYMQTIRTTYEEPVTRTRKVAREVSEMKIVPERSFFRR